MNIQDSYQKTTIQPYIKCRQIQMTESEEETVIIAPVKEPPISPRKKIVPGHSPKRKFENLNVSKSVSLN